MEERQREALKRFGLDPDQLIHQDGRYWMTCEQLGTALGYRDPRNGVLKIIERHRKEIQSFITAVKLTAPSSTKDRRGGGSQDTTVIDTDGQYRIALLANTPQAVKFRTFVVNMLRALERQEFVHVSQVREWHESVVAELDAWHDELRELQIGHQLEKSRSMDMQKFRKMVRYRSIGLTQKETAKLLDVSRDTVQWAERIAKNDRFGDVVNRIRGKFQVADGPRLRLVEGGAA